MDPVEAEMFDRDGFGQVQVSLLSHETLNIPFTFLSLVPFIPPERLSAGGGAKGGGSRNRSEAKRSSAASKENKRSASEAEEDEEEMPESVSRVVEVKIVSGTHGHVVAVIRVEICPRPFILDRVLRFYEPENSIMKRRIQLVGYGGVSEVMPGDVVAASKYVHCVENNAAGSSDNRVVVEWGPSIGPDGGACALDLLLRYRCPSFPEGGDFFLLLYDDPYQGRLHEVRPTLIIL